MLGIGDGGHLQPDLHALEVLRGSDAVRQPPRHGQGAVLPRVRQQQAEAAVPVGGAVVRHPQVAPDDVGDGPQRPAGELHVPLLDPAGDADAGHREGPAVPAGPGHLHLDSADEGLRVQEAADARPLRGAVRQPAALHEGAHLRRDQAQRLHLVPGEAFGLSPGQGEHTQGGAAGPQRHHHHVLDVRPQVHLAVAQADAGAAHHLRRGRRALHLAQQPFAGRDGAQHAGRGRVHVAVGGQGELAALVGQVDHAHLHGELVHQLVQHEVEGGAGLLGGVHDVRHAAVELHPPLAGPQLLGDIRLPGEGGQDVRHHEGVGRRPQEDGLRPVRQPLPGAFHPAGGQEVQSQGRGRRPQEGHVRHDPRTRAAGRRPAPDPVPHVPRPPGQDGGHGQADVHDEGCAGSVHGSPPILVAARREAREGSRRVGPRVRLSDTSPRRPTGRRPARARRSRP